VCDDSLVAREMLAQILSSDPGIEVVGQCRDGEEAVAAVADLRPDLVTMDIHMPRLDGVAAIEQIMAYDPVPILVVSSSVHGEGVGRAFDALSAGALEVMKKPESAEWADLGRIGRRMIRTVKILAQVHVVRHPRARRGSVGQGRDGIGAPRRKTRIVAIGSSTGGPSALVSVLGAFPKTFPVPVVVAQHIAEGFIPGLVEWLGNNCPMRVKAADDGEALEPGCVYFAPTGGNLVVDGMTARFADKASRQVYVPSADDLLASVADGHGRSSVGILLTGMGADGSLGLKAMRVAGATTIAQDEATSVVWGMPRAAVEAGAACEVLPLGAIGPRVAAIVGGGGS
jgi:two-component system chemotaxis response regulator CheB